MHNISNREVIEQMFNDFEAKNIPAVLSCFDKDIEWVRPGAPFIPFSGDFKGIAEVTEMFKIQASTIKLKTFVTEKICSNEDTVVILGCDIVDVIATGKSYSTDWVQSFTLKDRKIIHVQVYLDTKSIADAFLP